MSGEDRGMMIGLKVKAFKLRFVKKGEAVSVMDLECLEHSSAKGRLDYGVIDF